MREDALPPARGERTPRQRAYEFLMGRNPDPRCVNEVEAIWAIFALKPVTAYRIARYLSQNPECLASELADDPADPDYRKAAERFIEYRGGHATPPAARSS